MVLFVQNVSSARRGANEENLKTGLYGLLRIGGAMVLWVRWD
jgi:hypothetical protein